MRNGLADIEYRSARCSNGAEEQFGQFGAYVTGDFSSPRAVKILEKAASDHARNIFVGFVRRQGIGEGAKWERLAAKPAAAISRVTCAYQRACLVPQVVCLHVFALAPGIFVQSQVARDDRRSRHQRSNWQTSGLKGLGAEGQPARERLDKSPDRVRGQLSS
jgi:hypothetical protein